MKSVKVSLYSFVVACLLCLSASPAFASLGDAWGMYINDDNPGWTVELGSDALSHQLEMPSMYFYAPDVELGHNAVWQREWVDGEGDTSYTHALNDGVYAIMFLDTSHSFSSAATLVDMDWSTPEAALASAGSLGLDWFTVGWLYFGGDYSTVLFEGYSWDGGSSAVESISDSFTRATPIPGAIWLLGSGIVGLAGLRRKVRS